MPVGVIISESDKDEIYVCHVEEMALNKIANLFSITPQRVKRILLKQGVSLEAITRASGTKVFTSDQKEDILVCHAVEEMSFRKIAEQYNTNHCRIKRILQEMGAF